MSPFARKKKICKGCTQESWIYARGLCSKCYSKENKKGFQVKKKPKPAFGFTSEKELFLHLWGLSDKRCVISKAPLIGFLLTDKFWSMFMHVLSKGAYPGYRLNPDNIMIVHPDIHDLYDNRGKDQQDASGYDFSVVHERKEILKRQYYE